MSCAAPPGDPDNTAVSIKVRISGQLTAPAGIRGALNAIACIRAALAAAAGTWAESPDRGMVNGMAAAKITITLPERQLGEIRKRVAARQSPSVSGFVQQAVQESLENAAAFRAMVEEGLRETGGPLKPKERAWARRMLTARKRGAKPPKVA